MRRIATEVLKSKLRTLLSAAMLVVGVWMVNADAQQPPPSGERELPKVEAPAPAATAPS